MAAALAAVHDDKVREAQALEKLGWVLIFVKRSGRAVEALQTLERAIDLSRALGDVEGEARALAQSRFAHIDLGTTEEGLARLEPILDALVARGLSVRGQAELYIALGRYHMLLGHMDDHRAAAKRAEELARVAGDQGLVANALNQQGMGLIYSNRAGEALLVLEQAVRLGEATGDFWQLANAIQQLAHAYGDLGHFTEGLPHSERALQLWEQFGDPKMIAYGLSFRAWFAYGVGEWVQARALCEQEASTVSSFDPHSGERDLGFQLKSLLGWLQTYDEEARTAALVQAIEQASWEGGRVMKTYLLAEQELLAGRAEEARARLAPIDHRTWYCCLDGSLPPQAWAYAETGADAVAEALLAEIIPQARAQDNWLLLVGALRVRALMARNCGAWELAEQALAEALALCERMPDPYSEAKTRYEWGRTLVAKGELDRAREEYAAALTICGRLGEGLYRPHIERALAEVKVVQ